MPPSTSTRENALANIKTTLEAVTAGSSYNYTIGEVYRADGPFFAYLDDVQSATVAFIEEGQSSWAPDTHGGKWLVTLEVFIGIAHRYEPNDERPLVNTGDSKSTIRSKMVADVIAALLADNIRGGAAERGFTVTDDGPQNLDDIEDGENGPTWFLSPWVAHEIRFEMAMIVDESSP